MIEVNELRIGNLVYDRNSGFHEIGFNCFQKFRYPTMDGNPSGFKPIPITEDILLKCGFDNIQYDTENCNINYTLTRQPEYWIQYHIDVNEFIFYGKNNSLEIILKSLHQLQNLYYALTKQELLINLMILEYKHITPYLPYGLTALCYNKVFRVSGIDKPSTSDNIYVKFLNDKSDEIITQTKLILRPLVDLTKEIEHDGGTSLPIKKLETLLIDLGEHKGIVERILTLFLEKTITINQLPVAAYDFLVKYHFDIFDLIDKGLAIDINTIKKQ